MGTETMGKVLVSAKMESIEDLFRAGRGEIPRDRVRAIEVVDALVDTGASMLLLPRKYVKELGLVQFNTRKARGVGGTVDMPLHSAVRLTIQGRACHLDVGEVDDDFPVIVGQIPLEMLDWVVDPKRQRLIGNPDHGGQEMVDVFYHRICPAEIKHGPSS
jgi:predicted aspartyl protease